MTEFAKGGQYRCASKLLVIDRGKNGFRVNDLFSGLLTDDQGIGHEVVDHAGIALGVAVDGGQSGFA